MAKLHTRIKKPEALVTAVKAFVDNPSLSVAELAVICGASERNIYRWIKRPEWESLLTILGHPPDDPRRKPKRRAATKPRRCIIREISPQIRAAAYRRYKRHRKTGCKHSVACTRTASAMGKHHAQIKHWAAKLGWETRYELETE